MRDGKGVKRGNFYGEEGGRCLMAATISMGMGTVQRTQLCYDWREGDDGGNEPWFVREFLCVWRGHKNKAGPKNVKAS